MLILNLLLIVAISVECVPDRRCHSCNPDATNIAIQTVITTVADDFVPRLKTDEAYDSVGRRFVPNVHNADGLPVDIHPPATYINDGYTNRPKIDGGSSDKEPSLDVKYNATSGRASIFFDKVALMPDANAPTAHSIEVQGMAAHAAAAHNSSYAAGVFTQIHLWGQWTLRHAFHPANNSLDLTISIVNTHTSNISSLDIFPLGNGEASAWQFPGCNSTGCYTMRSTTDLEHSGSPCPGSWTPLTIPKGVPPPQCIDNVPQIILADYSSGALVATLPENGIMIDGAPHVYLGFPAYGVKPADWWLGHNASWWLKHPIGGFNLRLSFSSLPPNSLATAYSTRLSLRFAVGSDPTIPFELSNGRDAAEMSGTRRLIGLANDSLAEFRMRVPNTVHWPDRRPIGCLFFDDCGAGCHCNSTSPASCPNPRGWSSSFGNGTAGVNTTNPAGVALFQQKVLDYVTEQVDYCVKGVNGSGMGGPTGDGPGRCQSIIMWSIEGQEFPQDISYVCSPDQLPELAPEMDAIADALFKIVTGAGLKCGLCLRPQNYSINPAWKSGSPPNKPPFKYRQAELDNPDGSVDVDATVDLLIKKAKYAYDRWGCDVFYVDSTSFDIFPPFTHVKLMPGSIWQRVHDALPHILFIPETTSFDSVPFIAPLRNDWSHAAQGSGAAMDLLYGRDTFSVELMQMVPNEWGGWNVSNASMVKDWAALVGRGDIMLTHLNDRTNTGFVKAVYESAHYRHEASSGVAAVVTSQQRSSGLVVTFNETDGNRTVTFDGHRLVSGIPTIWSATPAKGCSSKAKPHGMDCWAWPRQLISKSYDPASQTFTQVQNWGVWSVAHSVHGSTLDMHVSVTNSWNMSIDMDGVTLNLFGDGVGLGSATQNACDFGNCSTASDKTGGGCKSVRATSQGACPGGWTKPDDSGSPRCSSSVPQVLVMDSDVGALVATMPMNPRNLTFGFPWVNHGFRLEMFATVAAGETISGLLSLRFAPAEALPSSDGRSAELLQLANDTFANWRQRVPNTVAWPDRGPIGGLFPSDYNQQNPKNPRGWDWMFPRNPKAPSITTPAGIQVFNKAAISWMNNSVQYCLQYMGDGTKTSPARCQGLTVWSLEGQEYPQDISYIGAPDMLKDLAPEMDAIADQLFKLITDAGLKCGVTLRPQQLTLTAGWKPGHKGFKYYQKNLLNPDNTSDVDAVAALLVRKASYAYNRWGCTMFYTDTTVTDDGRLIPAEAFLKAHKALPQVVFFPEESDFQYRSGTAPLQDNWGGKGLGTPVAADVLYGRKAFVFELMQFTPGGSPAGPQPIYNNQSLLLQYAKIVKRGDILRYQGWYNDTLNVFIKKVYEMAATLK